MIIPIRKSTPQEPVLSPVHVMISQRKNITAMVTDQHHYRVTDSVEVPCKNGVVSTIYYLVASKK